MKRATATKATRAKPVRAKPSRSDGAPIRPETVDAYIAGFPPEVRRILERVRRAIRKAAPDAEERISYRMPAFRHPRAGIVAWFGGFEGHVGFYPPVRDAASKAKVARHAGPKGNLRFRYDEPIPYASIEAIVKARVRAKAVAPAKSRSTSKSKSKSKAKAERR